MQEYFAMNPTYRMFWSAVLSITVMWVGGLPALGQGAEKTIQPSATHVPDDELTLVIATRFVRGEVEGLSPAARFNGSRVPLSDFNEADTCVDEASIDVAKSYFKTLGTMLEKGSYLYEIPDNEVSRMSAECRERHGVPPVALEKSRTSIIAYGRVVPSSEAPDLEKSLR